MRVTSAGERRAALCLCLFGGVLLGLGLVVSAPDSTPPQTLEWLDSPRRIGHFVLESETGVFDRRALTGQWTIVSFGFLNCPDICPTALAQLASLSAGLNHSSATPVRYLFVSVDPARDSLAQISHYVAQFDSSIEGATGEPAQLRRFADGLGVQFKVTGIGQNTQVAHSITYSIVDPSGSLRGRFKPGFDAAHLIHKLIDRLRSIPHLAGDAEAAQAQKKLEEGAHG